MSPASADRRSFFRCMVAALGACLLRVRPAPAAPAHEPTTALAPLPEVWHSVYDAEGNCLYSGTRTGLAGLPMADLPDLPIAPGTRYYAYDLPDTHEK